MKQSRFASLGSSPKVMVAVLSILTISIPPNAQGTESFVASADNPVLSTGQPGTWDGAGAVVPNVVIDDGTWYLFYFGQSELTGASAIGFATSTDGIGWTKAACNPILTGDGNGFDATSVASPVVRVSDGTWHMYYSAIEQPVFPPDRLTVGYATAPDPCGPWTRLDTPVLTHGGADAWDADAASPDSIVETDDGFVLYYTGSADFLIAPWEIGMAMSTDGITWIKYDDPTTTAAPFAESDPVLSAGSILTWDSFSTSFPDVIRTGTTWEMYYGGVDLLSNFGFGYATSSDGITWVKSENNPIFTELDDPIGAFFGIVEAPHIVETESARLLFYDYGRAPGDAIGLAISDVDGDTIADTADNCLVLANTDQRDTNSDGLGNACDADLTNDCLVNFGDLALLKAGFFPVNSPDADFTGDDLVNFSDLALLKATFFNGPNPGPGPSGLPNDCATR